MSCATAPIHWAPQIRMPNAVRSVLRSRLEVALRDPQARCHLVWLVTLGSLRTRKEHPRGIPWECLRSECERTLEALGCPDPERAWRRTLELFPDTAERTEVGWRPHPQWASMADRVSLRSGVILLALTGQPWDDRYPLATGVTFFNQALYHECHDALEILWRRAEDPLKQRLRGMILLAGGFHHQQEGHRLGMEALWSDALGLLEPLGGTLETPWGCVGMASALEAVRLRLAWLEHYATETNLEPLWKLPRPEWEWGV